MKWRKPKRNLKIWTTDGGVSERMRPKPTGITATSVDGRSGMLRDDGRCGGFGYPQPHIRRNQFFYGDGSGRNERHVGPVS